jgi:hypothetical protein
VIVIDADVLIVDLAYPNDPNYPVSRLFLNCIATNGIESWITTQGLLEVVGKRSYNTPVATIAMLPTILLTTYCLRPTPDPASVPEYAGCTFDEVVAQMTQQMALGDAVMAVQIAKFAPAATALVTWNAKHFRGKLVVPVLTPDEWLQQQSSASATPPPPGPTP